MKNLRALLALILLSVGVACYAEGSVETTLVIKFTNTTTATYNLAVQPVITFDETHMIVTSEAVDTKYLRSDIENFHFVIEQKDGIRQIDAANFGFRFVDGEHVLLSGVAAQRATLYSLSGKVVAVEEPNNGSVELSLHGLPAGTYVLKVAGQSIKITK